jgi:hypothetical protein
MTERVRSAESTPPLPSPTPTPWIAANPPKNAAIPATYVLKTTPPFQDSKVAKMAALVAARNQTPINVYGKVIDQDGLPVPGAAVKAGVLLVQGFERSGVDEYSTTTDDQGRFSFVGLHGARFGLGFEKPGYEYNSQLYVNWWDHYRPDAGNPMVFQMWKLQGAQPMVKARIHAYIPCDGSPTSYNLTTGKQMPAGGNLTIRFSRNPVNIAIGQPFSWQLTLEVQDGGIQEVTDLYPNEAPADGYQNSISVSMPSEAKHWSSDLQRSYYFIAGDGQDFGRIDIDLTGSFQPPPTSFDADVYVNTAKSRDLEYDPTARTQ